MPKFFIRSKGRHVMVRVQEINSKTQPDGKKGWRWGHSKSLSIYGDITVDEIFEIIKNAIEKKVENSEASKPRQSPSP
jgi:hypothetical protein